MCSFILTIFSFKSLMYICERYFKGPIANYNIWVRFYEQFWPNYQSCFPLLACLVIFVCILVIVIIVDDAL